MRTKQRAKPLGGADLHTHTTASDGVLTPTQLVNTAIKAGLQAIAITDHDNTEGILEARLAATKGNKKGSKPLIEIIPGMEIYAQDEEHQLYNIHLVGLFMDPSDMALKEFTQLMEQDRINQKQKILDNLKKLGYPVALDEVNAFMTGSMMGRPHIARALMQKYPQTFKTVQDTFDRLLGDGKPAYVPNRKRLSFQEAIRLIKNAGGVAVLAHPGRYQHYWPKLFEVFKQCGGHAVEVYYSYHKNMTKMEEKFTKTLNQEAKKWAKKHGLLESGGSDYHALDKGEKLGGIRVPKASLEKLRKLSGSQEI